MKIQLLNACISMIYGFRNVLFWDSSWDKAHLNRRMLAAHANHVLFWDSSWDKAPTSPQNSSTATVCAVLGFILGQGTLCPTWFYVLFWDSSWDKAGTRARHLYIFMINFTDWLNLKEARIVSKSMCCSGIYPRTRHSGFKAFFEDKVNSMEKNKKTQEEPENYLDRLWGELGIDPNDLPDFIESGPVELEYDGQVLLFNQCVFRLVKPIELSVPYVKIQLHNLNSPSLNRRIYVKKEDGSVKPYQGTIDQKEIIISIDKLAEMLGRGWQAATNQQGGMGGGIGGM